jgi:SGNH domain (fused to AT3 domains)
LLVLAAGSGGVASSALGCRPMAWVGDHSYAIYLWHWPLIVLWKTFSGGETGWLDGPALVGLTFVLSWLTKRLVEDPVRLGRAFSSRGRGLVLALTSLIPVCLVSTHLVPDATAPSATLLSVEHPGAAAVAGDAPAVENSLEAALPRPENAKADRPGYYEQGCEVAITAPGTVVCEFGELREPTATVALVGDSKAGQWLPALEVIAEDRNWRIVTYLRSRCPWTATATTVGAGDASAYGLCHEWGRDVLDRLVAEPPDLVVTADRPVVGTTDHPEPDSTSFAAIADGMTAYWDRLRDAGTRVVAIRETPEMGVDVPDCLSTPGTGPADCARSASAALPPGAPMVQATMGRKAGLVDLSDLLCPEGTCQPVLGGVVVYRDAHHLTRSYTVTLAPYLAERLAQLGILDG